MRIIIIIAALFSPFTSFAKCEYSLSPDSVKVHWTGYKFTAKAAANGEFKKVNVTGPKSASSAKELITGTTVEIDPTTSDTGDKARDKNLKDHFFSLLVGPTITAKIKSLDKDKFKADVLANGVHRDVEFKYTEKDGNYTAEAEVDIMDFAMKKPYEDLTKACKDLHKGADGVVKTWTTVRLLVTAFVVPGNCDKK